MSSRLLSSSRSPSVDNIARTLTERIRSGQYRDGHWFPPERELVKEFGVSRTIVRTAVETLEKRNLVIRSPRCRTIVRSGNGSRAPLAGTGRHSLGLWIWPAPADPVAGSVIKGIYRALDHDTYRVVVGSAAEGVWEDVCRSEARFLEQMTQDRDIAGILLWYIGANTNLPALRAVRAAGIPMVFLDRLPPAGFEADHAGVDNEAAAERVVTHLLEQGHRRIAHISNMDAASTVAERFTGYRRALASAGIPFTDDLVMKETGSTPDCYEKIVDMLLNLTDPPTALFAVNDILALHILAALRSRGVAVPEKMAVAGFDGVERWMPGPPSLTTAEQPFERLGTTAVELLIDRTKAGSAAAYRHLVLEAPLRIHGSTCTPMSK